jgi:hypothetical protein
MNDTAIARVSFLILAAVGFAIPAHPQTRGAIRFTDVTNVAGVALPGLITESVAWGDYDNDGDLDLYVVNFQRGLDVLYRNDGPGADGSYTFTDVTLQAGTTVERSSRGMALLDYDRDGLLDIYVISIGSNMLYRNQGNLTFVDVAAQEGVEAAATGVGIVASDLDDDGWLDIFTGNRSFDPNRLFLKDLVGFVDVTRQAGITAVGLGMGVITFDYDNDGDIDLIVTSGDTATTRLWRNDSPTVHHWLTLKLIGTTSNRSAVGARVELQTPNRTTVQEISGGAGRGNQNSLPLEFGLGAADSVLLVTIRWPSGLVQTIENVAVDQFLTVFEGTS